MKLKIQPEDDFDEKHILRIRQAEEDIFFQMIEKFKVALEKFYNEKILLHEIEDIKDLYRNKMVSLQKIKLFFYQTFRPLLDLKDPIVKSFYLGNKTLKRDIVNFEAIEAILFLKKNRIKSLANIAISNFRNLKKDLLLMLKDEIDFDDSAETEAFANAYLNSPKVFLTENYSKYFKFVFETEVNSKMNPEEIIKWIKNKNMKSFLSVFLHNEFSIIYQLNILDFFNETDSLFFVAKEIYCNNSLKKLIPQASSEWIAKLTNGLRTENSYMHCLYILSFVSCKKVKESFTGKIIENMEKMFELNFWKINYNRIIPLTLFSEIIGEMIVWASKRFALSFEKLREKILKEILLEVSKLKDLLFIQKLLFSTLYPLRVPLIKIFSGSIDFYSCIMRSDSITKALESKFRGETNFSFFPFRILSGLFTCYTINEPNEENKGIQTNINSLVIKEKKLDSNLKFIFNFSDKNIYSKENFGFQYDIRIKSCYYKKLMDILVFIIVFFFIYYNALTFIMAMDPALTMDETTLYLLDGKMIPKYQSLHDSTVLLYKTQPSSIPSPMPIPTNPNSDEFVYAFCYNLYLSNFLIGAFPDQVSHCIQSFKTNVNLQFYFGMNVIFNYISLVYIISLILRRLFLNLHHSQKIFSAEIIFLLFPLLSNLIVVTFATSVSQTMDSVVSYGLISIFYINLIPNIVTINFFFYYLTIQHFNIKKELGLMVYMIFSMIKEVFFVASIYSIILGVFTTLFAILFSSESTAFDTFTQSLLTLFSYSLGSFTFTDVSSANSIKYIISGILICIFLLTLNIVVINLLIAVLSNIYNNVNEKGGALYSQSIVGNIYDYQFDKKFGFLFLLPPPFNFINLVFLPILAFESEKKWCYYNKVLCLINYIILFIVDIFSFLFFLGLSLPFAYFRIFLINVRNGISRKSLRIIFQSVLWIFCGVPFLFVVGMTNDLKVFVSGIFTKPQMFDFLPFKKANIIISENVLTSYRNQGIKTINVPNLIVDYRNIYLSVNYPCQNFSISGNKKRVKRLMESLLLMVNRYNTNPKLFKIFEIQKECFDITEKNLINKIGFYMNELS